MKVKVISGGMAPFLFVQPAPPTQITHTTVMPSQSVVPLSLAAEDTEQRILLEVTRFLGNSVGVLLRNVCFQIKPLTMVNSIGLLEDGDLEPSSPGRPKFDKEYGKYSDSESDSEGEGEDRDEADDEEG